MTQSPIVKYGVAGIIAVGAIWGYEAGSTVVVEAVSLPLVEEIKSQTKDVVRPVPANLQTLYLVQVNEGDFPTIGSAQSPGDWLSNAESAVEKESSVDRLPETKVNAPRPARPPEIAASTEAGVILAGYGFLARGETINIQGKQWRLKGSFEKGYSLYSS